MARSLVANPSFAGYTNSTELQTTDTNFTDRYDPAWYGAVTVAAGSKTLYGPNSVPGVSEYTGATFSVDQYSVVTIGTGLFTFQASTYRVGAVCRISGSVSANGATDALSFYAFVVPDNTSAGAARDCYVYKKTAGSGTLTQLGAVINTTYTGGDTVELEAEGTGTVTLRAYKNGTLLDTRTDSSSPLNSGDPGLLVQGAPTSPYISAAEFGDLTSAPTITGAQLSRMLLGIG